jgi:HEAT repeat protein
MTSQDQHEQERQRAIAEHNRISAPVCADLRNAGFEFNTLDELRRSGKQYRAAIPILLSWLPKVEALDVKESIVRTLSVPWARGIATKPVLEEFFKAPKEAMAFRWVVGNAMEVIADSSVTDEILSIVGDASNGMARQMFVLALGKLQDPRAIPLLIGLLMDEEVAGHAAEALGNLKAVEAKAALEATQKHPKAWVRKAASTALSKIATFQ